MFLKVTSAAIVLSMAAFAQPSTGLDTGFQIRYASNLTAGDSVINVTNTGRNGANWSGPGFGVAVGNICVNAYTFSPDEQLISCCSCPLTPNGLVSLSANNDLISNTLTGVRPNSIVIKLLATRSTTTSKNPNGTDCTNSAALAGSGAFQLVDGMAAWGTTLHVNSPGSSITPPSNTLGNFAVTETAFTPATLSTGPAPGNNDELDSITNRCQNIIGNGSTFGICKSCRVGGLGADKLQ